jgi:hypothetical protein
MTGAEIAAAFITVFESGLMPRAGAVTARRPAGRTAPRLQR